MKFQIVSLFPDLFASWHQSGLVGQAFEKKLVEFEVINPRAFTTDVHHAVDDKAYGGSDGMVQAFTPWSKAIEKAKEIHPQAKVAFMTPQGPLWNQRRAEEALKATEGYILVCGRYAGFDERLIEAYADEEISVGDYVLNGGELPAMVVMESLIRGIPGALGQASSFVLDSFSAHGGLLECPVFTRPQEISGHKVPDFLLSGHHEKIEAFRKAVSIVRTHLRRPDLLQQAQVSRQDVEKAYQLLTQLSAEERKILGVQI